MPNINKLSKYLKVGNVQDGDVITFTNAGAFINKIFPGDEEPREIFEIGISLNGDEKIFSPNGQTRDILSKAWGQDTEKWVGKRARITIVPFKGRSIILAKPITETVKATKNQADNNEEVPF